MAGTADPAVHGSLWMTGSVAPVKAGGGEGGGGGGCEERGSDRLMCDLGLFPHTSYSLHQTSALIRYRVEVCLAHLLRNISGMWLVSFSNFQRVLVNSAWLLFTQQDQDQWKSHIPTAHQILSWFANTRASRSHLGEPSGNLRRCLR